MNTWLIVLIVATLFMILPFVLLTVITYILSPWQEESQVTRMVGMGARSPLSE